jgi:hypothetical protein
MSPRAVGIHACSKPGGESDVHLGSHPTPNRRLPAGLLGLYSPAEYEVQDFECARAKLWMV